jgi:hypothetical protein
MHLRIPYRRHAVPRLSVTHLHALLLLTCTNMYMDRRSVSTGPQRNLDLRPAAVMQPIKT